MLRKPAFWIAFTLLSVVATVFAIIFFPRAFPLVSLELTMDREGALATARRLAEVEGWGPEGFRQAASFGVDGAVQSYVELEGGGSEAFGEMIRGELYAPYTWQVRHFKPGETHETRVRLTPQGEPWGFAEILSEDAPGAALEADAARRIAEEGARAWGVDLGAYELVESSDERRPGGRTDHAFVYERPDVQVGVDGRFRLRLVVAGDRFTGLSHLIRVPEAFERRFEEMRSANTAITVGSSLFMIVVYLGACCGVGLFVLFRERRVIWKAPLVWGICVAFGMLLVGLNEWPLLWMSYDTAVSVPNFVLRNVALQILGFVGLAVFFSLAFMAGESLTRRAFPEHVQLWRTWSTDVAASRTVLGYTVAAYLGVGIFIAYEVVLYFFAHRGLGWWSPSDALFNPDQLATWMPWVTSIGISLQAGFMEECLFRAVPLATAALLGRRFGGLRWWIAGAMVVQALVFGAGHAAYPTLPSYARVVELILPSIGFGLIYLRLGLLPAIVLHYVFDVALISIPVFVSEASGAWISQVLIVLLALVPLGVVVLARLRAGAWGEVAHRHRNGAWTPPAPRPPRPAAAPVRPPLPAATRRALGVAGLVGLVAWGVMGRPELDAPPLEVKRSQAITAAREELARRGVELGEGWRVLSSVDAGVDLAQRFVWQEGGPEAYRQLLGRFLPPPVFHIRWARFEGDVAEVRAEEHHVWISGRGEAVRYRHQLPEARSGAELEEPAARQLARQALAERWGFDPDDFAEIGAAPTRQPARLDWEFTFQDTVSYSLERGEARAQVRIAGDEVVDAGRFVHLPEDWERAERNRQTLLQVVAVLSGVGLAGVFFAGMLAAIWGWIRRRFAVGFFLRAFALLLLIGVADAFNGWPAVEANLSTAQPLLLQQAMFAAGLMLAAFLLAIVVALSVGLVHRLGTEGAWGETGGPAVLAGFGLGVALAAVIQLADRLGPAVEPAWPAYAAAGSVSPMLAAALEPVGRWLTATAFLLLVVFATDRLTTVWSRRRVAASVLFIGLGLIVQGAAASGLTAWLVAGSLTGLVLLGLYVVVLRHGAALVVPAMAAWSILEALRVGWEGAWPGVLPGSLVGAVLTALVASYWMARIRSSRP